MIRIIKDIQLKKIVLLVSFSLLSVAAFSQTDTVIVKKLITLDFEDLINMPVSSASKIGQKTSEAPSVISIVPRDQVKKYNWETLNDIAFKQAGFSPGQDRFNQVINSRGISDLFWNKRLLVLVDGIPFSSFQTTVTDRGFSINMANSVEIIRGPGSVLYGSQAVTGVIQVNTVSFDNLKGKGEAEVKIGDFGYRNINLLTGVKGEFVNTLISFNHYSSNGNEVDSYDAFLKKDKDGNFIKQRTQDEKSTNYFWAKLEGRNKLNGLSLSYHLQDHNFQMGHGFLTIFPEIEKTSNITRNYILLKYVTPPFTSKLVQEYALKYDYEIVNMDMQIAPIGFLRPLPTGGLDSSGIYEQYITPVHGAFARAQWIYFFDNSATLLGGIEQNMVLYKGDILHHSNVNLSIPGFLPFSNGKINEVGPLYEAIFNRPVNTTGVYAQASTGKLLGEKLIATIGARYDIYYYEYKNLKTNEEANRKVSRVSPRISLVNKINNNFTLRAVYSNAFRLASPFEQFISNSIITGINTENIKPEVLDNYELSADWVIRKRTSWRNTIFYADFRNQIRSSRGRFNNIVDDARMGGESEFQIYFQNFTSFANYSYVKRINETSKDTLFKTSDELVWYPEHSINAGINYQYKKSNLSVQGHYQSLVDRRSNEKGPARTGANAGINYDELRGSVVSSWFTMDMSLSYRFTENLEAKVISTNLLNEKYFLINNLGGTSPQPFDYQQTGRRIMVSLKLLL